MILWNPQARWRRCEHHGFVVRRSDPINDRQLQLLARIVGGDTLSKPADSGLRTTAYALQARGLITTSKRAGVFTAVATDAGKYYLEHGRHPDAESLQAPGTQPTVKSTAAKAQSQSPSRSIIDEARAMIDRLQKADDRTVRVSNPDDKTRALYRRAFYAAKYHAMVPEGTILRYTGRSSDDIIVHLQDASNPDETAWNQLRLQGRKPKFPSQDLRQLLAENPAAMQVSGGQRERAVDFLMKLNAEAGKRDQQVRLARRGEHAKLGYRIGDVQWDLTLSEEYIGRGGRRVASWEVSYSHVQANPTGKLRLTIGSPTSSKSSVWEDEKRSPIERRCREIVTDVTANFERAQREAEQARRKWQVEQEEAKRRREAEHREWESAIATSHPQAMAMLRRRTLIAALRAWRDAEDLRDICEVLDDAALAAAGDGDAVLAENIKMWCSAGLEMADRLDPTVGPASLGNVAFDIEPAADDLRPHMKGWSPNAALKEYSCKSISDLVLSRPWPPEWDLGKLG